MDELIERLADAEHASWGRWMLYLFETCQQNPDGSVTIPPVLVGRWDRQANTPYRDLTEREKESDRDEVRRILPLIEALREQSTALRACLVDIRRYCGDRGGYLGWVAKRIDAEGDFTSSNSH